MRNEVSFVGKLEYIIYISKQYSAHNITYTCIKIMIRLIYIYIVCIANVIAHNDKL